MGQLAAPPPVRKRVPLRIADVDLLYRRGAFDDYGRVELIGGELIYVNAEYRPHMMAKSECAYRLRRALEAIGSTLFVGIEGSVAVSDHDLPRPDIILTSDAYGDGPVPGASVTLVVEIADTTVQLDLGRKQRLYAKGGIPEYWVFDVTGKTVHQMAKPAGASYRTKAQSNFGDSLTALTIPRLTIVTPGL